ncbi:MAG: ABC transporter substrate-binding protein [Betaproteobacteria bacterium]|nr:ABC transporter substrate-binding protein [Betaproteobacteria bacterium]
MISKLLRILLLAVMTTVTCTATAQVEKPQLIIAVGGKSLFYYLPLTIAERLGYFKEEGLDVTIADFPGGAKALQSLIGGSADLVSGAYEHTINMQAKKQMIKSVVVQGRYAGIVLGLSKEKAASYKSPKDLKGLKIGVTAPGSSTNMFVNALLAKDGLKPDAVSYIGVGAGSGAVAAMQMHHIDGIANLDPVINLLEVSGDIVSVVDTRKLDGQHYVYGNDYAAGVIYTREDFIAQNPKTVQAVVNAMVHALRWIQKATPEQIVAIVPPEYYGDAKALYRVALGKNLSAISPDGKMSMKAAENVYSTLKTFEPSVQKAGDMDLARTFDNHFVVEALKKYP